MVLIGINGMYFVGAPGSNKVAKRPGKKGKEYGNNIGQGGRTNGKEGEENAEEKARKMKIQPGRRYESDRKGRRRNGRAKDIGKKGQEKVKIYNERKVMQGNR